MIQDHNRHKGATHEYALESFMTTQGAAHIAEAIATANMDGWRPVFSSVSVPSGTWITVYFERPIVKAPETPPIDVTSVINDMWQDLLDKDDRTSPEEYPDMALITFDEFECVMRALTKASGE